MNVSEHPIWDLMFLVSTLRDFIASLNIFRVGEREDKEEKKRRHSKAALTCLSACFAFFPKNLKLLGDG